MAVPVAGRFADSRGVTEPSAFRPVRPSRLRAAALLLTGGAVGAAAVWAAGFFDRTAPRTRTTRRRSAPRPAALKPPPRAVPARSGS